MSKTKGGGSTRNGRDSNSQRLGVKVYDGGVVTFWGDGTQPIEVTSVEDTAGMVARVALDRSIGGGKFSFAGDRVSFLDATRVIEDQAGRQFARRSLGLEADLRAALAEATQHTSNSYRAVMLAYSLYMLTDQTALSDLQNDHYSDIPLETFPTFAARALPSAAS